VSLLIAFGSVIEIKGADFFLKIVCQKSMQILIYPSPPLLVADQVSRVLWQLVTAMHHVGDE
jgi:hypothetical protein